MVLDDDPRGVIIVKFRVAKKKMAGIISPCTNNNRRIGTKKTDPKGLRTARAISLMLGFLEQCKYLVPGCGPLMHGEDRIHLQICAVYCLHDFVHQFGII